MKTVHYEMNSPAGRLYLTASENGLKRVDFRKTAGQSVQRPDENDPAGRIVLKAARQLEEYFAGQRKQFDLPLDLQGTSFQKQVWRELSRIPFGRTVSYSDVARGIKNPKAVRAVGGANGKNPVAIIVPCHRVIAADGSIGGYSGGLPVKRRLLDLEGNEKFL